MARTQISVGTSSTIFIADIGWKNCQVLHAEVLGCETINYLVKVDGEYYCNALLHGDHFFSNDVRKIGESWGQVSSVEEAAESFGFTL